MGIYLPSQGWVLEALRQFLWLSQRLCSVLNIILLDYKVKKKDGNISLLYYALLRYTLDKGGVAMSTLGDRLARVRGFRRMSQQVLAERTGLKVQNISRLETDHREHVRSDTLRRLAEALGCSTDYLVGLSDDPTPPKRPRSRKAMPVG
jgi:DNA-binding Xre family transcriptional regulator